MWEVRVPKCPSRAEVLKTKITPHARCALLLLQFRALRCRVAPQVLYRGHPREFFLFGDRRHFPRNSSKGSGRFSAEQDHRRLQKHRDARRKHLEGATLRGGFQGVRDPPRPTRPGAGVVQFRIRQRGAGMEPTCARLKSRPYASQTPKSIQRVRPRIAPGRGPGRRAGRSDAGRMRGPPEPRSSRPPFLHSLAGPWLSARSAPRPGWSP